MTKDRLFRPSSIDRAVACPGSVLLCRGIPSSINAAARTGTAAHKVLEMALKGGPTPAEMVGRQIDIEDGGAKVDFTDLMADGVQMMLHEVARRAEPGCDVRSELWMSMQPLDMTEPLLDECAGTSDVVILNFAKRRISILDYKNGRVPVAGNSPQLRTYGLLGLINIHVEGGWQEVETVVVQPNMPHEDDQIKAFTHSIPDIWSWAGTLFLAMKLAVTPDAPLIPGAKQCHYCPAARAGRCPALAAEAQNLPVPSFPPVTNMVASTPMPKPEQHMVIRDPMDFTPEELLKIKERQPLYEAFMEAIDRRMVKLLEVSPDVFGGKYGLKRRSGNRKWVDPDTTPEKLRALGVKTAEMYTEPKLKSPKQIEDLLPNGSEAKKAVNALAFKPEGDITLVREPTAPSVQTVRFPSAVITFPSITFPSV